MNELSGREMKGGVEGLGLTFEPDLLRLSEYQTLLAGGAWLSLAKTPSEGEK